MAILYITEYQYLASVPNSAAQMPMEPFVTEQQVGIGASSAQSATLNAATIYVRLNTDASCVVLFGTNPTASVAGGGRMATNQTAGWFDPTLKVEGWLDRQFTDSGGTVPVDPGVIPHSNPFFASVGSLTSM